MRDDPLRIDRRIRLILVPPLLDQAQFLFRQPFRGLPLHVLEPVQYRTQRGWLLIHMAMRSLPMQSGQRLLDG